MLMYPEIIETNRSLVLGDNIQIMKDLIDKGYSGKFDMIYFDGPFNSGLVFSMVNDSGIEFVHPWGEETTIKHYFNPDIYLEDYKKRISLAKELLSETGIFVLQTNLFMSHYVKIKLDEIFGRGNLLCEVIWKHSEFPWSQDIDQFGYQHETLFFYSKSSHYFKKKDVVYASVWDDLGGYGLGEENTFFPSQKPEALLNRIVEATTKEGDLIGDFYCGSGTLPMVAEKLKRRWFACDNHAYSIKTVKDRFSKVGIDLNSHSIVETFNRKYLDLDTLTYTKTSNVPFSNYELEGLKDLINDKIITINAYSYSPDVDTSHHQFKFNMIMPVYHDGIPNGEKTELFLRPTPIKTRNGYSLQINNPLKWVFYHLVHVERDKFNMIKVDQETGRYHKSYAALMEEARELVDGLKNNWIKKVEYIDDHIRIVDIFGYTYLCKERGNG